MGGEGGAEKLRRSRRLSSTRGLRAPGPNFGEKEKISEPSVGMENRGKTRENGNSKPGLELLNVSGFPREEERKYRGNFRAEIDLTRRSKIDDVIKSDSKYEIGIPDGGFLKNREKGNLKIGKIEEKQASKSEKMEGKTFFRTVKTVEKSISKTGKLEENPKTKYGKSVEKSCNFSRKNESTRTNDSIAKRLELIHELNQKILANYDKFQQRSRKYVDRKSTVNGQQSEIYAQVKRKCKTQTEKYSDSLKSRKIDGDKLEFSAENRQEGKEKKRKKITGGCDVNENFRLAAKPEFPLLGDSNLRERITKAAYSIRSKSNRPEKQGKLAKIFPAEIEETLGNSKFYPGNSEENFDNNINCHGKSKFYSKISTDLTEKNEKFQKLEKWKISSDNFSHVKGESRKIVENVESFGTSKFSPENSSGVNEKTKNRGKIPEKLVDSKLSPENSSGINKNIKNLQKPVSTSSKSPNFPQNSVKCAENVKNEEDPSLCSEDSLEPETSCSPETSDLEREILRGFNDTLAEFSRGKSGTSDETEDGEGEEVDQGDLVSCLSDDSVNSEGPNVAKGPIGCCLDSSWDSGVGVDVGNGGGWVRILTGIQSSLVYLTLDTTAGDVCRDMLLGDDFALFLQYGGENGRRLASQEKPLELQDYYLQRIGYHHVSRRARLGVDPELRHLIAFHVGPACPAPEVAGYSRCGDTLVLKGLVFPQWKKRALAVLGSRLFLYPGCRESWPEWMELAGGAVCYAPSRLGKLVLRVTGFPRDTRQGQQSQTEVEEHHPESRHIYLGFQHPWDRDLWKNWLKQATQLTCNPKKLDLSRAGLSRIPDSVVAFPVIEDIYLGQNQLSNTENNLCILQRFPKLSTVKLEGNNFAKIPRDLLDLTGLTHLDLSGNKIEKISPEIQRLVNLKELILDGNLIKDLPDELGQLKNLRSISLVGNYIVRLPSFLTMRALTLSEVLPKDHSKSYKDEKNNQNNLQKINLRNNQLKGNIILGNYGNLTHLDVSENSIEKLDIGALQELKSVRCAKNLLTELTLCGRNLVSLIAGNNRLKKLSIEPIPINLEHLDVSYNNLDSLPEWTPDLPMLRALFASHNTLTALPDRLLSQPSRLEVLHLPHNRLQALPPPRRALNIVHLTLQGNALTTLPPTFFGNTEKMKVLNLSNNRLSELPYFCENNKNRTSSHGLEKLYLTANCLTDTALDALAKFTALRTLHIAYNTLDTLPESCIASWSDLEELVLSGNRLQYLPDNVANLEHLRVLRVHSNRLLTCPTFSKTTSLKVLDLAHNQLDRVNLATLVPPQLQFLDISCNSRLHVDPRQFQVYRSQRPISLVDVSGQNRPSLPSHPQQQEIVTAERSTEQPWRLGFSETAGCREKLFVSQVRMPSFCNVEGLFGIFDGGSNQEAPSALQEMIPRLLLEERTVRETAKEYLKYTLLSAHRELKEKGQKYGIDATLLHLVKIPGTSGYPVRTQRYCLKVASSGEAKAVLCRAAGPLTLAPPRKTLVRNQLGHAAMFPLVVPDPNLEEVALEDDDEFVIVANRRFWEVLSVQEAVREARAEASPVLAAKRLQDLAQAYGAEDNLSVIVLRLAGPGQGDLDQLMRELRHAVGKNRAQNEGNCVCPCCLPQNPHKPPGACCCHANEGYYLNGVLKNIVNRSSKPHNNSGRYFKNTRAIQENESPVYRDDRSSPSGQSDQASDSTFKSRHPSSRLWAGSAASRATSKARQSVVMHENGTRKVPSCPPMQEDASSERSGGGLSEEQFRCWEYMLEQNTQLLFDKELDTLTRSPLRRGQSRSTPQLAGNLPFLSKRFGSARSFNPALPRPPVVRFGSGRRLLNGGPNAAYFGSLQRLMPYNLEYDFAVIQERAGLDSLEQDASRMQQYWGVATTEL